MANIIDYLRWRGDLSLHDAPFNEVDALVLSHLAFLPFDSIVSARFEDIVTVRFAAEEVLRAVPDFHDSRDLDFCRRILASRRFGRLGLSGFRNHLDPELQKQFCALTVHLGDDLSHDRLFVAFRGTDGTLTGWREDFNMTVRNSIPAQVDALAYVREAARRLPGDLILGGHSKGGNLAVYSAVYAPPAVQDRITAVYSFDGPGFHNDALTHPGFERISARIHVYVPQTSIVGMMMGHAVPFTVVHSTQSGLGQHDQLTWEVDGTRFVTLDRMTTSSRYVDQSMKDWFARLTPDRRQVVIDAIFDTLDATGVQRTADLGVEWARNSGRIVGALRGLDKETRADVRASLGALMRAAGSNLRVFGSSGPDLQRVTASGVPVKSTAPGHDPTPTARERQRAARASRAQTKAHARTRRPPKKGSPGGMWTLSD